MKLTINNISKSYGTNRALVDFCADFEPGIYALLGPNGSGKSTLMNIITDNLKADSGEILFSDGEGEPENTLKMGVRFREKLGFMPQYPGMYPGFTAEQFLRYMATLKDMGKGLRGKEKREYIGKEITSVLASVELDDVRNRKIGAFSGGMKQRLALASAVLGDPEILILDDSASALDYATDAGLRRAIREMSNNATVFIVSQRASSVMHADKIIVLDDGAAVAH